MKLSELFKEAQMPDVNFSKYLNRSIRPALDTRELTLEALAGGDRSNIRTPYNGTASLLLRYKNREGGLLSIDEQRGGETWDITQVQGAKSKKSYRIATGLNWHLLLGQRTQEYAIHPESEVRQLTMAPLFGMQNIEGARSESIDRGYAIVRNILDMKWSEEMKLFVADVRRNIG